MYDAIYVSAVGLQAQKEQLDAAANNLANANTPAFKRQRVDFSAILDRGGPARVTDGLAPAAGESVSKRVRVDLAQGEVVPTGRSLDVAIQGNGFLEVLLADGRSGYSRGGSLKVNDDGALAIADGRALKADVRVPSGATGIAVAADGTVTALLPGDKSASVLGQLDLVTFVNPDSLQYQGEGVFVPRAGASDPTRARPGEDGTGTLVTGALEASNIRMVDEMVSLMLMQRVYELNAKVMQAADEMVGMTNNLRRG